MSKQTKTIFAFILFAISAILGIASISVALKPSVMPLATIAGAFTPPALFFWWGIILYRSAKKMDSDK